MWKEGILSGCSKPLISDKVKRSQNKVLICDDRKILSENKCVSNAFNEYFNNIVTDVGQDSPYNVVNINEDHDFDVYFKNVLQEYESHSSIVNIRNSNRVVENHNDGFPCNNVELGEVERKLRSLKIRTSPGCDNIPPKLIEAGSLALSSTVMYLINMCLNSSVVPYALKRPKWLLFIKRRESSVKGQLSSIKGIWGRFSWPIIDVFWKSFSKYASGFRKGNDCQSVLIRFSDSIKSHLDNNNIVGAVLTDLSKAFDCLPYDLLLCKFCH